MQFSTVLILTGHIYISSQYKCKLILKYEQDYLADAFF